MVISDPAVKAAKSVLIDLLDLLRDYENSVVVAGGWVPSLSPSKALMEHIGTTDVDLMLDFRKIPEKAKPMLREILQNRGYHQSSEPFTFCRSVDSEVGTIDVKVDFLTFEPEDNLPGDYYRTIQGIKALKVRGGVLAFQEPIRVNLKGELPDGTKKSVSIRVVSSVPFLVLKSLALFDRRARKDAYDIYFYLKNFPRQLDELVDEIQTVLENKLVKEGIQRLAMCFSSVDSEGPKFVADFLETQGTERKFLKRDAFEQVNYILEKLGLSRNPEGII